MAAARARPGPAALIGPRASAEPGTPGVAGGSGQRPAQPERRAHIPRVGPADRSPHLGAGPGGKGAALGRWGAWAGPSAPSRGGAPRPCPRGQTPASLLLSAASSSRDVGPLPRKEKVLPLQRAKSLLFPSARGSSS